MAKYVLLLLQVLVQQGDRSVITGVVAVWIATVLKMVMAAPDMDCFLTSKHTALNQA